MLQTKLRCAARTVCMYSQPLSNLAIPEAQSLVISIVLISCRKVTEVYLFAIIFYLVLPLLLFFLIEMFIQQ